MRANFVNIKRMVVSMKNNDFFLFMSESYAQHILCSYHICLTKKANYLLKEI